MMQKARDGATDARYDFTGDERPHPLTVSFGFLLFVAVLPLLVKSPYWLGVVIVAMYFAMLAAAWNLLSGYVGQISLAPAAFAMLGGYTSGLLWHHLGIAPLIGIGSAVVVTALLGLFLGRITFKLSGPYFTLTTLGFAEISRLIMANSLKWTRGDLGLHLPPLLSNRVHTYYLFLIVLALVQLGLYGLLRSRAGLFLQAIRDDEIAAAGRGVDVVRWKTIAFALSSAICGLGGALYVHFSQLASPEMGLILQSGLVLSMVVVGGLGTLVGPLVGAFIVQVSSEMLRMVGVRHMLVFALLVIIIGRFMRHGLWGAAEQWIVARRRRRRMAARGMAPHGKEGAGGWVP